MKYIPLDRAGRAPVAYARIAVIGAGSWGTALAIVAARAGRAVALWGRDADMMAGIAEARENAQHLPGCPLPDAVTPTEARKAWAHTYATRGAWHRREGRLGAAFADYGRSLRHWPLELRTWRMIGAALLRRRSS